MPSLKPLAGTAAPSMPRRPVRRSETLYRIFLGQHSDVDLLNLTDSQREFVIERFASHDVYRRFVLDVGQTPIDKAPNATIGLARLKQAHNCIRQTIAESFRLLREGGQSLTTANVRTTVANALANSLSVFEGYLA